MPVNILHVRVNGKSVLKVGKEDFLSLMFEDEDGSYVVQQVHIDWLEEATRNHFKNATVDLSPKGE